MNNMFSEFATILLFFFFHTSTMPLPEKKLAEKKLIENIIAYNRSRISDDEYVKYDSWRSTILRKINDLVSIDATNNLVNPENVEWLEKEYIDPLQLIVTVRYHIIGYNAKNEIICQHIASENIFEQICEDTFAHPKVKRVECNRIK